MEASFSNTMLSEVFGVFWLITSIKKNNNDYAWEFVMWY